MTIAGMKSQQRKWLEEIFHMLSQTIWLFAFVHKICTNQNNNGTASTLLVFHLTCTVFCVKFYSREGEMATHLFSSVHLAHVVLLICLAEVLLHGSKLGKMLITSVLM